MNLAPKVLAGETRYIARALTWIENDRDGKEALIDELFPHCGHAVVWGITGPPGAGKSTLTDQLITRERRRGRRVGVIAVDPSSPFSGGAILGDRLRMQQHATDDGVFIRSMASRGHLGGVAGATGDAIKVLDAAGFDTIILETIGVGQTEIEVMELADVVLLVMVPGLGDEIQALKAGVMEIGDIFVVNKADRDGADKVASEIGYVLDMKYVENPSDRNPICLVSALRNEGIDEMMKVLDNYLLSMEASGCLSDKRRARIVSEIRRIAATKVEETVYQHLDFEGQIDAWVDDLFARKHSPYVLMHQMLDPLFKELESR
ncbi:methylmalonyl Co-A mutase-associated GTPase MeaB [bacterium]|nr:methylmalonyl Co-A mutase-associated GTPase MeaB [bacterium]